MSKISLKGRRTNVQTAIQMGSVGAPKSIPKLLVGDGNFLCQEAAKVLHMLNLN